MNLFVGVDLGATKVRVATGNETGIKASYHEESDKQHGADGVADQISRMIRGLLPEKIIPKAIGIGSIGPLDLLSGCIRDPPNLPFKLVPLTSPLQEEFEVPIYLINDCTAAALGEQTFGAARGLRNNVYVTISTGIGGGAIVDGHLLIGKDGNAVEVGHITVDPEGTMVCGCGCRGHWEAYCSGANIPNLARHLLNRRDRKEWSSSLLLELSGGDPKQITAEILFKAAGNGDKVSRWIVERIGELNAIGFADLVNLFDPELITIGGSVALNNRELILEPIMKNIRKHTINRIPEICMTPLGDEVVLYGALALACQRTAGY